MTTLSSRRGCTDEAQRLGADVPAQAQRHLGGVARPRFGDRHSAQYNLFPVQADRRSI